MSKLIAYPPKPGVKMQVIGAGLPRTATNSFCAALAILLDGPPYHAGVQTALGDTEDDVLAWTEILRNRPYKSETERKNALKRIAAILDGYSAATDTPLQQLIPELMEVYPDAKVIVTTRDIDTWAASMEFIAAQVRPRLQRFIFFWIGNIRHLPAMWDLLPSIYNERYQCQATTVADAKVVWERHHRWLEEIVPKEKLFYVNVKDGWGSLCKALDVPVPKDVPFPRLNDGKAFEEMFRSWALQGLLRWAVAVLVLTVTLRVVWTIFLKLH